MPPLVDFRVIVALDFTIGFGWDDSRCAAHVELLQQPIRIKRLIRQQRIERDIPDERRNALHIMGLSGQKLEAHEVAECINQCHDLGRQPAARASDGLSLSPPFAPVAFW